MKHESKDINLTIFCRDGQHKLSGHIVDGFNLSVPKGDEFSINRNLPQ
jgi:hypothetical protein